MHCYDLFMLSRALVDRDNHYSAASIHVSVTFLLFSPVLMCYHESVH